MSGFSIVEVLVSMSIMTVVALGSFNSLLMEFKALNTADTNLLMTQFVDEMKLVLSIPDTCSSTLSANPSGPLHINSPTSNDGSISLSSLLINSSRQIQTPYKIGHGNKLALTSMKIAEIMAITPQKYYFGYLVFSFARENVFGAPVTHRKILLEFKTDDTGKIQKCGNNFVAGSVNTAPGTISGVCRKTASQGINNIEVIEPSVLLSGNHCGCMDGWKSTLLHPIAQQTFNEVYTCMKL